LDWNRSAWSENSQQTHFIGLGITRGSFGDGKKNEAMKQIASSPSPNSAVLLFGGNKLATIWFLPSLLSLFGISADAHFRALIAPLYISRQAIVVELTENLPKCSIQNIFQLFDFV
jgi:hypothetical protein